MRARRSIKLGSGVKLNLNKRSVGLTVGGRGAHYTVNSRGQRTTTVGIPGSGSATPAAHRRANPLRGLQARAQAVNRLEPRAAIPAPSAHPGVFARHYERAFYLGTTKLAAGEDKAALAAFRDADTSDDKHRAISPALFAGVLAFQLGDHEAAVPYLERVTNSALSLPDNLMHKYAPSLHLSVEVNRISLPVPMGSVAAAMLLAECYCETGRLQEAIGLAQKLHEHSPSSSGMLLFLCSMYLRAEDWDEIVHATAGISNEDDITLMLRLWQAQGMEKQGLPDTALEAYRDALKSKKRDEKLLKEARYLRAKLYIQLGKRAMAKRDLGRLYGEDPDFEDVRTLLASLG